MPEATPITKLYSSGPEYMPTRRPPATNYASIRDAASLPFLGQANAEFYRRFLGSEERPRALVVGEKIAIRQSGGFDPIARAMEECRAKSPICMLYAYDDDVVWTGPEPGQTARINHVPILGKAAKRGEAVVLQRFVALTGACEPRALPEVSIAQSPAHGRATTHAAEDFPAFDSSNPLSACNAAKVPMLHVDYESAADFRGVDFLALTVFVKGKPDRIVKYAIHVD